MALTLISDLNIDLRSAREEFKKNTDVKADKIGTFFGELTEVSGDVDVEGRNSYIWFKQMGSSHPVQILNRTVSPTPGLPVIVGNRPPSEELEVLEIDTSLLEDLDIGLKSIVAHAPEHLPGGGDMLWVDPRQLSEFAVYPASGLSISVAAGYYNFGNQTTRFPGLTGIDISSSQPLATQHIAVGVYLDLISGAISTVNGTAVLLGAKLSVPTWPTNSMPLAIVDLDGSQTTISFANDIISTKGTLSDSIWKRQGSAGNIYYDDGDVGIGNALPLAALQVGPGTSTPLVGTSTIHAIGSTGAQITVREETDNTEFVAGVIAVGGGVGFLGTYSNHDIAVITGNDTKIYLEHATGNVSIGKGPVDGDKKLEVLDASAAQLRLTHTAGSKFADFTVDTNHNLSIDPSSTGLIKLAATVTVPDEIQHEGDTDTNIGFTADVQTFKVGGVELLKLTEAAQDLINLGPGSGDVDINFNGDMFLTGSTGHLTIGPGTTAGTITVEVSGDTNAAEGFLINNDSTGTSAYTTISLTTNAITKIAEIVLTGQNHTTFWADTDTLHIINRQNTATTFRVGGFNDASEKMRIDSTGLGVGTSSPSTRLDIGAGAMTLAEMTAPGPGGASEVRLYAVDNGGATELRAVFGNSTVRVIAVD